MAPEADSPRVLRTVAAGLAAGFAVAVGYAVLALPAEALGLREAVGSRIDLSGVSHPVTAVLLNFRGYDTLLEVGVLLLAIICASTFGEKRAFGGSEPPGPVLLALTRLLLPVMVVTAGFLLWLGAHAPGGAFQAGAVLGAAGVLWQLAGGDVPLGSQKGRMLLALGIAVFLAVAVGVMLLEGQLLQYPPGQAGTLILIIESAATVSIGLTLAALFSVAGAVR